MKASTTYHNPLKGKRLPPSVYRWGAALFWLAVWQLCAVAMNSPLLLPRPLSVLRRLSELVLLPSFWQITLGSLMRVVCGFALGLAIGWLLALVGGWFPAVRAVVALPMGIVKATPVASFVILALLYIHREWFSVFISLLMVLPMAWSSLDAALASTDSELREMAWVYRLTWGGRLRLIYLPSALPHLLASARTGLGFAWKAGIAAEVIAVPPKAIGTQLYNSKVYLETVDLFGWTVTVIILSLLMERLMMWTAERLNRRKRAVNPSPAARCAPLAQPQPTDITLSGICRSYEALPVLEGLSLELPAGSRTVLMGRSGRGKTTLLRLLAGLEPPDSGTITGLTPQSASLMFQENRLLPWCTIRENLRLAQPGAADAELMALLEQLGLEGCGESLPHELSGGMARRAALARALLLPSALLLLDEPFTGLDAASKAKAAAVITQRAGGKTLVAALHDATDAELLGARVVEL